MRVILYIILTVGRKILWGGRYPGEGDTIGRKIPWGGRYHGSEIPLGGRW
tara:strand:- start:114 stop:263 length:150 start_codon:yes stop_codon:yes gene_type:complete